MSITEQEVFSVNTSIGSNREANLHKTLKEREYCDSVEKNVNDGVDIYDVLQKEERASIACCFGSMP